MISRVSHSFCWALWMPFSCKIYSSNKILQFVNEAPESLKPPFFAKLLTRGLASFSDTHSLGTTGHNTTSQFLFVVCPSSPDILCSQRLQRGSHALVQNELGEATSPMFHAWRWLRHARPEGINFQSSIDHWCLRGVWRTSAGVEGCPRQNPYLHILYSLPWATQKPLRNHTETTGKTWRFEQKPLTRSKVDLIIYTCVVLE